MSPVTTEFYCSEFLAIVCNSRAICHVAIEAWVILLARSFNVKHCQWTLEGFMCVLLTFSVVQPTWCVPPVVCLCRYIGGFFAAPNLLFLHTLLYPVPPPIHTHCSFVLASPPHFPTGYGPRCSLIYSSDVNIDLFEPSHNCHSFFRAPFQAQEFSGVPGIFSTL